MKRLVQPELLDALPPENPRAVRSRRDLRRINWWMRSASIMAGAMEQSWNEAAPRQITEIGAGDGNFLLGVAKKTSHRWPGVKATLLDLHENVSAQTLSAFTSLGWRAEAVVADVFDWPPAESDIVIANLFLHHFEDSPLVELLGIIARRAKLFIALEPRRAAWPLFGSRLLWAIGCNDVTRHDAVVSVRGGFARKELSTLWPDRAGWKLSEQSAGMFSHLFVAKKTR